MSVQLVQADVVLFIKKMWNCPKALVAREWRPHVIDNKHGVFLSSRFWLCCQRDFGVVCIVSIFIVKFILDRHHFQLKI